jgi:hypothetical protein
MAKQNPVVSLDFVWSLKGFLSFSTKLAGGVSFRLSSHCSCATVSNNSISNAVVRWLGYITPHRYSFRAFMRNEYTTINGTAYNPDGTVQFYLNGTAVLEFYGYFDCYIQTIGGDLGVLLAFSVSYIFLFYLVCEFYWK